MNKYETIMILNSELKEKEIENVVGRIEDLINKNGKVTSKELWGVRKLAYPIKKKTDGYYVLMNFKSEAEFIDELNRIYNNTEEILKHIVVKND